MGTEIDLFKTAAPAPALAGLEAEDLSEGIGSSYGIIGYRGKTWSLRMDNQDHVFTREDGTPIGYLDVIILRQGKGKSKSYYPSWDQDSKGERPTCASMNGIVPDADVQQRQAESCAVCPHNVFKTMANGRKGKECSDYKRLAVFVLPSHTAPLFAGQPLIEPLFLRVPPASLQSLAALGKRMTQRGYPNPAQYVTRIKFEPTASHPQMVFEELQPLTDVQAPTVIGLRNNPLAARITGEDAVNALPAPQAQPARVTAPVTQTQAPAGFGATVSAPVAPVAPVAETANEDVGGDPMPSTADLDARIAALMPKGA